LLQELVGFRHADLTVVLQYRAAQFPFDTSLELTQRQPDSSGDLPARERFVDMREHDCVRTGDGDVRAGGFHLCSTSLLGSRRAMAAEQQMLGDFAGEVRVGVPPDPGNHQVEDGRRAGAGDSLTATHIELCDRAGLGIVFLKSDGVIPMHGNLVSVEQPRRGKHQAAVFDATDLDTEFAMRLSQLKTRRSLTLR